MFCFLKVRLRGGRCVSFRKRQGHLAAAEGWSQGLRSLAWRGHVWWCVCPPCRRRWPSSHVPVGRSSSLRSCPVFLLLAKVCTAFSWSAFHVRDDFSLVHRGRHAMHCRMTGSLGWTWSGHCREAGRAGRCGWPQPGVQGRGPWGGSAAGAPWVRPLRHLGQT